MASIPDFFLSSFFLMFLWDAIAVRLGIGMDINYVTAMLLNIALWIAIAPLAAVSTKKKFFG
ncbi:MAG: hypothetical protein J7L92_07195 [Dehalococcoidia bacterium]|nr:hypothetical protein [Dehalococcoidia bacterium]RLC65589.1 MAG: hypothetical protein DRI01_00280 [Chloroflexota bacterium]